MNETYFQVYYSDNTVFIIFLKLSVKTARYDCDKQVYKCSYGTPDQTGIMKSYNLL